jgi:hypothetical protein
MNDKKTKKILANNDSVWRTFDLQQEGQLRRTARYTAWWYERHGVQHTNESTIEKMPKRLLTVTAENGDLKDSHLRKLLHCVQSAVNDKSVAFFMIGKASARLDKHAHAGMVARFGDKYKKAGYSLMVALMMIDGSKDERAEHHTLMVESKLHALYGSHPKFDGKLSNAQSGSLSKKPKDSLFTLYLAICFIE